MVFLTEEMSFFERALLGMRMSIQHVSDAIHGKIPFSPTDRAIADSLLLFEVPSPWHMVQKAPHLSLANGIRYMQKQGEQLVTWAIQGAQASLREKTMSKNANALRWAVEAGGSGSTMGDWEAVEPKRGGV